MDSVFTYIVFKMAEIMLRSELGKEGFAVTSILFRQSSAINKK